MASKPFVVKNGFQFPVGAAANKVLVSDASGNASWVASAPSASAAPWSGITDKPNTLSGYGIGDALTLGSTAGVANGTAAAGVATTAAKSDHVHPLQTSVSGNAGTATKLADARSISITGDATWTIASFDGSANVTAALTLANSGVTAGTYRSVTVDAKGRVTTGTNPTTLAQYGITDAAPLVSPTLTGAPTAPTATTGTNTTQIATTAFVQSTVGGYLAKSVTGGTVTLTDEEASVSVIAFTGTLTSNASINVPTSTKRVWNVVNNTTGAFTLTVKTSAGTGVTVSQGKRAIVYNDGVNVYDGLDTIALTGTPVAPTASGGTNTTQIATTAFVASAVSSALSGNTTGSFSSITTSGNLTVGGSLIVNGTTTTVNSTTVTVDDPIITLGGDTAPASDDGKDRGVEFRWHNGTAAKVGFFGFDDSTGKFIFIPDATNTSEVFSGAAGTIVANLEGNATTATTLATARTIAGVSFNGSANIDIPFTGLTNKPNSISGYGITDALTLGSTAGAAPGTAIAGVATTAARSDHVHPLQTTVSGNAGTATALATGRSISITGDATWTIASFDGSANVTAALTLANSGVIAGTYRSVTVDAKGRVTAGTSPTTLAQYGITDAISTSGVAAIAGGATIGSAANVDSKALSTTTTTAGQVLDTFSATAYRSAKFFVQGTSGTSHHAAEVIVIHDGTTVQMLEYGTLTTGSSLFTLDADISGGNVRLLVTPGSTNMTFKAARTALVV